MELTQRRAGLGTLDLGVINRKQAQAFLKYLTCSFTKSVPLALLQLVLQENYHATTIIDQVAEVDH